jgi:hypothetical protein
MNNQLPDGFFCFQKHFEAPFYYFLEKIKGGRVIKNKVLSINIEICS